jgi:glycerophosphoryl diester phosphodiesterase
MGTRADLPGVELRAAHSIGKFGDPDRNEDRIVVAPSVFAVLDGSTAKEDFVGQSPGTRAVVAIEKVIRSLPATATAQEAVAAMTAAVADVCTVGGACSASVLLLFIPRNEVWVVGDGWVSVDGDVHQFGHHTEAAASTARAALLRAELQRQPLESLLDEDVGRLMIMPLLRAEALLSNVDSAGAMCFGRIDGRPVPDRFIRVISLPAQWRSVVLATDGYPWVEATLEASEDALRERIDRDPLMIDPPPMTKGVYPGQVSYDDRTWLELIQTD